MSDGYLQNILQTGFFVTSRARHAFSSASQSHVSTASSSIPRSLEKPARYRRSYPPPPVVEDEIVSLAKELGGLTLPVFDEEPQSRGEIDQQPIILDVFEYNPERRFVVLPGSSGNHAYDSGAEDKAAKKRAYKELKSTKSASSSGADKGRRRETKSDSAEAQKPLHDIPTIQRRKSRQDLPRIETDLEDHETPISHHQRTELSAGDFLPSLDPHRHHHHRDHHSRFHNHHHNLSGDEFLSPNVSKHSVSGRDWIYHEHDRHTSPRSQTPRGRGDRGEQIWDGKRWRSLTPSIDGRSSSKVRTTYERSYDLPSLLHRDGKRSSRSPRREKRDEFDSPNRRRESDFGRSPSSRKHRETSWSSVDAYLRNSRRRPCPVATDDGRSSLGIPSDDVRMSRSPSRVRTMPVASTNPEGFPEVEKSHGHRSAAPYSAIDPVESEGQAKAQLPYPDDDEPQEAWFEAVSGSNLPRQLKPGASITTMPHIPPVIDEIAADMERQDGGPSPQPSFESDRESASFSGSYRHYSDSKGKGEYQDTGLPDCSRTMPVAGLTDWLTLPGSDFNICPDCFDDVFAHTPYRMHFEPLPRAMSSAIACDFGSSPWYRVAWLLTTKEQKSDLKLLYKAASVLASTKSRPCPGSHKGLEFWYIVKDPFTRRGIPDFTACHECVKMVEALFPSLRDVFSPQDAWQEPTRSICALHYAPDRKQFVLYFEAFEAAAKLASKFQTPPDIGELCMTLSRINTFNECRESRRISDGYWYAMSFLPEFTVCGECYEDAVRPQQSDDNDIARSFHSKPRKIPMATCQLYSPRMRGIFKWACRRNDIQYLEERIRERRNIEEDLHGKFVNLVKDGRRDRWTEEQIDKLEREWRKWE